MRNSNADDDEARETSTLPGAERPSDGDTARHQAFELPSHDELAQLARDDPEAYEALRREVVDGFIDSAPERLKSRLSGIQFRVDAVRRLSRSSALGATVRVYELMWKSFLHLNDVWQDFIPLENERTRQHRSTATKKYAPGNSARVFEFRPRHRCEQ
jgi:hypothetical protein